MEIRDEITHQEDAAREALAVHRRDLDRLARWLDRQRPNWGKRLLRLPLIDAVGRPLSIDQIWLPELTIDYNFRPVARFDRCVTCHQGIDKTEPGAVFQPACLRLETLELKLTTPESASEVTKDDKSRSVAPGLGERGGAAFPGVPSVTRGYKRITRFAG